MAGTFRNRFLVLAASFGLTLFACVPNAFANALPVPISISPGTAVPAGLQSTVTFDARGLGGAANAGYYSRPVLVSNNTLGGLANGLLRRAAPVAAMAAAVAAAGWAIDELTKQVMYPASGTPPPAVGVTSWCATGWTSAQNKTMCGPTLDSFVGKSPGWTGGTYTVTGYQLSSATFGQLKVNNGQVGGMTVQAMGFQSTHLWLDYVPASPVPVANLAPLIKNNPGLWNDALRNPDGSVNRNPDVMAAANALAAELANSSGPQPDPTAEWNTGQQGGDPQGNTSPTSLEFPNFCAWASRVCELADWLQDDTAPPDEDPQVEEIPLVLDQSWNSGFGDGACPAPVAINVLNTDVAFSYQPLCDVAVYIKPIVLAGAALLCVFIIGGFRRAA